MSDTDPTPTVLHYAGRRSRWAFWVDIGIGVVGIVFVFPVTALIAYEVTQIAKGQLSFQIISSLVGLVSFGFGVWCVATAVRAWRRRNDVPVPMPEPLPVESLRWRWIMPGLWMVLYLLQLRDHQVGQFPRAALIAATLIVLAVFLREVVRHIGAVRGGRS